MSLYCIRTTTSQITKLLTATPPILLKILVLSMSRTSASASKNALTYPTILRLAKFVESVFTLIFASSSVYPASPLFTVTVHFFPDFTAVHNSQLARIV